MAVAFKKLYQGSPAASVAPSFQYPGSATTGGTLTGSGTRYYKVTAVVNGVETLPSAELSFTVPAGTNTNTVSLYCSVVQGASAYYFYGASSSGAETRLGTSSTPTFSDTGAAGTGQSPPSATTLVEATATPGLYAPPAGKQAIVKQMMVSNPTPDSGQMYLSHVTSGGTGGVGNRVVSGMPVPPDANSGPINEPLFIAMSAGDFLTGYVTVSGLVVTLFGLEL